MVAQPPHQRTPCVKLGCHRPHDLAKAIADYR
jgi:hypothetical protein